MSLFQYGACVAGWNRAQGAEDPIEAPSAEAHETLMSMVH